MSDHRAALEAAEATARARIAPRPPHRGREQMTEKRFPILGTRETIPWSILSPHEKQALRNHGQTLAELASRGGLSWVEALMVLTDTPWTHITKHTESEARARVLAATGGESEGE